MALFVNILGHGYSGSKHVFLGGGVGITFKPYRKVFSLGADTQRYLIQAQNV